jgi:excisionase family DNA binding protein
MTLLGRTCRGGQQGTIPMTKAYGTLPEAVQFSGMSRTSIYEALKRGDLTARKAGRRTLISFADLEAYLASLPTYQTGA